LEEQIIYDETYEKKLEGTIIKSMYFCDRCRAARGKMYYYG